MFGIGFAEIAVIVIVALLVFGPERLPEMAKQAASFVRDLRRMVTNARRDMTVRAQDLGIDEEDLRTLRELRNPKTFVREKVLDGVDLEDLGLDDGDADSNGAGRGTVRRGGAQGGAPQRSVAASRGDAQRPGQPAISDLGYDPEAT